MRLMLILYILFFSATCFSQDRVLKAYLNQKQFYSENDGNYLEVQLQFIGHTLEYVEVDSVKVAQISITHLFQQGDEIIMFDRLKLNSPTVYNDIVDNFYNIQRFGLAPGEYTYELAIKDLNSKSDTFKISKVVQIKPFKNKVNFSDVILAEKIFPSEPEYPTIFSKHGYDIIPMPTSYFPQQMEELSYYVEQYDLNDFYTDSIFVIQQEITTDKDEVLDEYTRYFRYNSSKTRPIAKVIDIKNLKSGKYKLKLSFITREKEILATKSKSFTRKNGTKVSIEGIDEVSLDNEFKASVPSDSAYYYASSIIPIAHPSEVKNILKLLKEKDDNKNRKYIQAFFNQVNPEDPHESWLSYKAQVMQVERLYATNYQMGHETDRGRVYLQYGQPSQLQDVPMSPSEYPYEIWQYDKIGNFSNRRFVFYNPSNLNQEYKLLHSDMLGELQNPRWIYELNKRNTDDKDLYDNKGTNFKEHWGRNSSLYYNSY